MGLNGYQGITKHLDTKRLGHVNLIVYNIKCQHRYNRLWRRVITVGLYKVYLLTALRLALNNSCWSCSIFNNIDWQQSWSPSHGTDQQLKQDPWFNKEVVIAIQRTFIGRNKPVRNWTDCVLSRHSSTCPEQTRHNLHRLVSNVVKRVTFS